MKFISVYLIVFCIAFGECIAEMKLKNIPSFFNRKFNEWEKTDVCEYIRIKSKRATTSLTRMDKDYVSNVRIKKVSDGSPLKKAELGMEIRGISRRKVNNLAKRKFIAVVQQIENPYYSQNITLLPTFVKGKVLELIFDITTIYNTSINDFRGDLSFTFRILRRNGKTVNALMRKKLKAFTFLYERVEYCNFTHFLSRNENYKRYAKVFRMMNASRPGLKSLPELKESKLCGLENFPVSFIEIGLAWIIHPEEMDIGICSGSCLASNVEDGYKYVQNAVFNKYKRGQPSTCQPTEFGGMTIIYIDILDKSIVIEKFSDMVVKKCSCQ